MNSITNNPITAVRSAGRRRRTMLVGGLAALALTTGATAAGTAGATVPTADFGDVSLAFANYTDDSPLFGQVSAGVRTAGEAAGMDVSVFDNQAQAEVALENAQLMVQAEPDVAVMYNPDPAVGPALGAVFERAGVPCIALNTVTDGCHWLNVVNAKLGAAAGQLAADYFADAGWDGTNTTVILLGTPRGGSEVNDTMRYLYVELARNTEGFEVLEPEEYTESTTRIGDNTIVLDGGASLDTAFQAVQSALQNVPDDQHILISANNDDKALGGWRAVEEAGRADTSAVIGFGSSEVSLEQLRDNPGWIGEIDALLSVWGYYTVAMAAAISEGAEPPELTELPFAVLTKENLADYYGDDLTQPLQLPEPSESNEYLFGLGILEAYGAG